MLDLKNLFESVKKENFILEICEIFIKEYGGNILEIGAGEGFSTFNFLRICDNFNKNSKVIVVDPFESGWNEMPPTYGTPYPFKQFESRVEPLKDYLELIKKSSQDQSVYEDLKNSLPITFSFVDGLQYKDAVINDLELMHKLNCKLICVDDFTRLNECSQVPLAVEYFLNQYDYTFYTDEQTIRSKGYLIKNNL